MNRRADQPIDHADIINNQFAPAVVAVSRLKRGLGQMFLDEYALFIREKQALTDLNVQHAPSSSVPPRGSNRSEVRGNPRTPAPLSTRV
jgi:hypothetical protein